MAIWVGTSGWQYGSWRGVLYPAGLPQRRWLAHYAEAFRAVEVNNTFYRLPEASTFDAWREGTPDDFLFVVKMSRFLTHIKRLQEAEPVVRRFMENALHLGAKLGPVLLQLPPNLRADVGRLEAALDAMPSGVRVAVEFREASWFSDEVRAVLERRNVALCLADRGSKPLGPLWRTADWGYLRMHEGTARPRPRYGDAALEGWAQRLAELWPDEAEVYAFFNNDPHGCAVGDATRFARALRRVGRETTRVPEPAPRPIVVEKKEAA